MMQRKRMSEKILKYYKSMSVEIRASLWFTICSIALKGVSLFTTPLFTRILPADEYGRYSIMESYMEIILIFSTWELALGTYQKALFKYKEEERLLTWSVIVFGNILTVLAFAVISIFWKPFSATTGFSSGVTVITFFYLMVLPAYNCWKIRKRVVFDYKPDVITTLLFTIVSILVPLLACINISNTAETRYVFGYVSLILFYLVFYIKSWDWREFISDKGKVREYFKYFIKVQPPLVIYSLSYMILGQADRLMIGKYVDHASAGIYSVSYSVASIVSIVQGAVATVLVPWTFRNIENGSYDNLRRKSFSILLFMSGMYLTFILFAPEIIILLFPKAYHEAIWCIPPVTIGTLFLFVQSLFVNVEIYVEKTKYIAYISVICSTLNIILNYFGIKMSGYIACAYTTLICYMLFALGHGIIVKIMQRNYMNNVQIYNYRAIMVLCVVVELLMIVIILLYQYMIIRYIAVVIISFMCFVNRKKLIGLYYMLKDNG